MNSLLSYKIYIQPDLKYDKEIRWVLKHFAYYCQFRIEWCEFPNQINIGISSDMNSKINETFFNSIYENNFDWKRLLDDHLNVVNSDSKIDYLSTAFYFLNCLWERDVNSKLDKWGRSEFNDSIWKQNGYSAPFNKVNECFENLANELSIEVTKRPSKFVLSHDIDAVYGAWKEDGLNLIKKKQFLKFLKLAWEHFLIQPHWFNFIKIANLESDFTFSSTFFWIPKKGKVKGIGSNADYKLTDRKIQDAISILKKRQFEVGIHKSLNKDSLLNEVSSMPFSVKVNRYHYLKFAFTNLIEEMNQSKLKVDSSLGYAEVMGYRNGFSLPFIPFDLKNKRESNFLEVPLTIMDGTFSKYKRITAEEAFSQITEFINQNDENALITLLWHNSHFTNYKYQGYPKLYSKLLQFLSDKKLKNTNFIDIYSNFPINEY